MPYGGTHRVRPPWKTVGASKTKNCHCQYSVGYFSPCCDKVLVKINLKREGFIWTPSWRIQSITEEQAYHRERVAAGHIAGHIVSTVRKQSAEQQHSACFLFLFSPGSQPMMTSPALRVGLPALVKPFCKHLHGHSSMVIPNPVVVTVFSWGG